MVLKEGIPWAGGDLSGSINAEKRGSSPTARC